MQAKKCRNFNLLWLCNHDKAGLSKGNTPYIKHLDDGVIFKAFQNQKYKSKSLENALLPTEVTLTEC